MSIRQTFSNSIDFTVGNKYDKRPVMEILAVLGHVYHVLVERSSETGLFRHLSNQVFRDP